MEPTKSLSVRCQRQEKTTRHRLVSNAVRAVCRKRASQRWSSLLTQSKSRIGHDYKMRQRLGEKNWAAFVRYAESEFKEDFFDALVTSTGVLSCAGKLNGQPCPHKFEINLKAKSSIECEEELPKLHLDHTYDVNHICEVWSDALPSAPKSWDDGICGPMVAQLLFGTQDHVLAQRSEQPMWRQQVITRCCTIGGIKGCHKLGQAHYEKVLTVEDIKSPTPAE